MPVPQNPSSAQANPRPELPIGESSEVSIPELVAEVFETVPSESKAHLLEPLLQPLSLLSLFGVAGGIFATAKLRGGWPNPHIRLEDIQAIQGSDVRMLVEFAQQVSAAAIDGLVSILSSPPLVAGSAATALLAALLLKKRQRRRNEASRDAARSASA